jgi:hypothetical protein
VARRADELQHRDRGEGLQFLEHGCWVNGKIVEPVRR